MTSLTDGDRKARLDGIRERWCDEPEVDPKHSDVHWLLSELERVEAERDKCRAASAKAVGDMVAEAEALRRELQHLSKVNQDLAEALRSETEAHDHLAETGKGQPGYTQKIWKRNRWCIRPVGPDESPPTSPRISVTPSVTDTSEDTKKDIP